LNRNSKKPTSKNLFDLNFELSFKITLIQKYQICVSGKY
jgi:hypothetical protein